MKKHILAIGLTSLFVISGCSNNENDHTTSKSNAVDPIGVRSPAHYYDTDSDNREKIANQVKRTAMSAVPRYYHVYVSDNPTLAQNIENYAPLESDSPGIHYSIQKTIKQMLKSPQGSKVQSEEKDANTNEQHN